MEKCTLGGAALHRATFEQREMMAYPALAEYSQWAVFE